MEAKSTPVFPFLGLTFVSSSNLTNNPTESPATCSLSAQEEAARGLEVSRFYQDVVSEPSASKSPSSRRRSEVLRSKRKTETILYKESDVFKFAESNEKDEVKNWLRQGFDVNLRDHFNWTPLMCAACAGSCEVVNFLLDNGADPSLEDKQGRRALDLALKRQQIKCVQLLIDFKKHQKRGKKLLRQRLECQREEAKTETSYNFCEDCGVRFEEDVKKHQTSIAHQVKTTERKKGQTYYGISSNNRGYQLMVKTGWNEEDGLGPYGSGPKYPVKTVLKKDRHGLGVSASKPRVTHFGPYDESAVSNQRKEGNKITSRKKYLTAREKKQKREKHVEIDYRRQFHMD